MKSGRVLVVFGSELPRERVFEYDTVIAPEALANAATLGGIACEPLEGLTDPGSIVEAAAFLHELATVVLPNGARVSESITYKGYQLWWAHYDQIYLQQCLPYTQYRRLLERLAGFSHVTLVHPPTPTLFRTYLEAHGSHYTMRGARATAFPSIGIWLQVFISLLSWPLLVLKRPRIMVYTGDLFDPPRDHSARMRFIYEELRARKLPFVEFIRSMEPTRTVLAHAWKRRRPVIYSYAIKIVVAWAAGLGSRALRPVSSPASPEQAFKLALASLYTRNARGTIWSIRVMSALVRTIGVRAALIPAAGSRTFHEVLGCRMAGVPTVGILHGVPPPRYVVYDFVPEYRGAKRLSLDVYGLWSEWWRDYYIEHSKAYTPGQLVVSGPMRPLVRETVHETREEHHGLLRILFISEQLAAPGEVMPYLSTLLADERFEVFFKFRSYRDGFEDWLKVHHPELLERVGETRMFRGTMQEAIAAADVTVGSHSTAVLEAVLQEKPMVFFNTHKWGDCFDLEPLNARFGLFAKDPEQLVEYVVQSQQVSKDTLKELCDMFFGDPYGNGSAWVVDQLEEVLVKGRATK